MLSHLARWILYENINHKLQLILQSVEGKAYLTHIIVSYNPYPTCQYQKQKREKQKSYENIL
jgi:hypothetical protein